MQFKHLEMFTGRVGVIEDLREFDGGCVLNFSVAETQKIKKNGKYEDGATLWTNVSIFGDEARNVQKSIKPGTFVTVLGERKARDYIVRDTNEKRTSQSVLAEQVSIAITRFNFISGMENINYNENGDSQPSKQPAGNTTPKTTTKSEDPFADDVFGTSTDPFTDEDDPFGLG